MFTFNEVAITGLFLTTCVLTVVQNDGWSKAHCPNDLCVKYRAVDTKQFCRIYNFRASHKKSEPIEVVFVVSNKKKCLLVLNSVVLDESKELKKKYDLIEGSKEELSRKFDLVEVSKEDFK